MCYDVVSTGFPHSATGAEGNVSHSNIQRHFTTGLPHNGNSTTCFWQREDAGQHDTVAQKRRLGINGGELGRLREGIQARMRGKGSLDYGMPAENIQEYVSCST